MAETDAAGPFAPSPEAIVRLGSVRRDLQSGSRSATVVVVGAGKSGLSAVELLRSRNISVSVAEDRPASRLSQDVLRRLAEVELIPLRADLLKSADLVVLSPGVPRLHPELAESRKRGVLVGEIEVASWFLTIPLVGITGTNGKSTTTALTAHLFEAGGMRVFAGGNLGRPLSDLALLQGQDRVDVAVVELSSYQLESIVFASFDVACWLNLTPDHADRYVDLLTYAAAKRRILEVRSGSGSGPGSGSGVAVLNAKDAFCSEAGLDLGGRIRWFAADPHSDLAGKAGTLLFGVDGARRSGAGEQEVYDLASPYLPGNHNRANMCAAIECARALGVQVNDVGRALLSFRGLPHRIELVGTVSGVRFYNDSKATNVDSAVTALRALSGPKILIAGGKDKGAPWDPLVDAAAGHVKAVLAIGEATPIVLSAFTGRVPHTETAETLERAVTRAMELAEPGDSVLLSPACASFDQFENYEHRGDVFRQCVGRFVS